MKQITLLLCLVPLLLFGQESVEPQIVQPSQFWYISMECKGPYNTVPVHIQSFMGQMTGQGLFRHVRGGMFGMYPGAKDDSAAVWYLGFVAAEEAAPNPPLAKGHFECENAASIMHIGPFSEVQKTYDKLFRFIEAQGYEPAGPVIETWLDNPQMVAPEKLRTQIQVPVKRKTCAQGCAGCAKGERK